MCIYFIHKFFECLLFLSCWSDHASTACKCTVWRCVLYIPFEMNQGKCMFFCLILIEPSVQVSYMYTAIECVQITETNWWKKNINSLSEHCWMFLKMLNSRGGANFTLIFFFYIYVQCITNSNKSFACISSVKMLAHWDWH